MGSVETVTALFTDLVGSTELASRAGPERAEELRVEHFGLLREAIGASNGREVKNLGDGLMAVFPSAAAAIDCAASMQQRIEVRNRRADEAFAIRIGVALGDATYRDGDYFGPAIVEAARLCAQAAGGQALLTEVTRVTVGRRGAHRFSPVGRLELKGLPDPVAVSELVWEPLPATTMALPKSLQLPPETGPVGRQDLELEGLDQGDGGPFTEAQEGQKLDLGELSRAGGVRVSSERFVGREDELAVLEAESGTVLIAGDAGVGKSRLVAELERRARSHGKLVLIGECVELTDWELPYAPIVAGLRPVLRDGAALESLGVTERRELARLWPELGPFDGAGQDNGESSSQARVFALLLELMMRLGNERPVVFIIEDLHWADRSTRDFLAFLVRAARGGCLSVVMTLRAEELHREHPLRAFVAELARVRGVRRLELAPFTRQELALQVEGILGERPPSELVTQLFDRAEGNAFYTEELLAASAETELPRTLRDVLLVRIERLSQPARRLLAVAATAGRTVDERLLGAVGEVPDAMFAPALREALAQQVLVARDNGGAYTFRHALVREAVYGDLLASERAKLHAALARALVRRPELAATEIGIAGELAHHWYAAGELVPAFEASVRASADAERAFAFAETERHCRRALGLWDRVPDPARASGLDRPALLTRAARAAVHADHPARAARLARQAVAELDPAREPVRVALVYMLLGRALWLSADHVGALEAYGEAVRRVPSEPASSERALVLAGEAQALMLIGRSTEAHARCEEALELARAVGDRLVQAHVHNTLAGLAWLAGDPVEHAAIARRIAFELGAVEEIGRSYANGSEALELAGHVEEAIALAEEGIAAAPRWGLHDFVVYLTSSIAGWQLRLGRFEEAERLCADATPRGNVAAAPRIRTAGQLATARGEFSRAETQLERAEKLARGAGGPEWWPATLAALGVLRLWQGRLDDAAQALHQALDAVDHAEYAPWLTDFVDVYPTAARVHADRAHRAGAPGGGAADAKGAADALAQLERMLSTIPEQRRPPRAVACRRLAAAEATRADGRSDPSAWRLAADGFRALHEPYTTAYAMFRQAEALVASGADGAAPLLQDARAITVWLGERPLHAGIEALAQRAGIRMDHASFTGGSARPS
jgi:class 3 adenylate cyclase/tetratricopeptide (TPR) repeat protein